MAWTMTREGRAGRWRSVGIFAVAAVSFSSFLTAAAEAQVKPPAKPNFRAAKAAPKADPQDTHADELNAKWLNEHNKGEAKENKTANKDVPVDDERFSSVPSVAAPVGNGARALVSGTVKVVKASTTDAAFKQVPGGASLPALKEVPSLAEQVKAGSLPPVDQRIPKVPSVVTQFSGSDGAGIPGGELNMLVASARDTRLMTIYANARLIVYDEHFKLHPDILESYEDKGGREFTFKLRAGHKWSDGTPFTTEDFRYFWEDIANNKELSPRGPSVELLVDDKPPKVEIIDELTIRYTWDKPNPYFIESQARAAPLFLYRPAHYLRKVHAKYASAEDIAKAARGGQQSWVQIHRRVDVMYANDNPDMPTLNPWKLVTAPPAQRFVFQRNPFYYRIDEKGHQLPYTDRVIFTLAAPNLVPAKAGLGEADLQPRYLNMRDYTFLRKSAKSSHIEVRLWESGSGSQLALYPNLNAKDEVWRKVFRDVRVRRALFLAIDQWNGAKALSKIAVVKTVGGIVFPGSEFAATREELALLPGYQTDLDKSRAEARRLLKEAGAEGLTFELLNRNVDQPYVIVGTWLVDEFYDRRVKLIVSAAAIPGELYAWAEGGDQFERTISRLIEMQTRDYLSQPHLP